MPPQGLPSLRAKLSNPVLFADKEHWIASSRLPSKTRSPLLAMTGTRAAVIASEASDWLANSTRSKAIQSLLLTRNTGLLRRGRPRRRGLCSSHDGHKDRRHCERSEAIHSSFMTRNWIASSQSPSKDEGFAPRNDGQKGLLSLRAKRSNPVLFADKEHWIASSQSPSKTRASLLAMTGTRAAVIASEALDWLANSTRSEAIPSFLLTRNTGLLHRRRPRKTRASLVA